MLEIKSRHLTWGGPKCYINNILTRRYFITIAQFKTSTFCSTSTNSIDVFTFFSRGTYTWKSSTKIEKK